MRNAPGVARLARSFGKLGKLEDLVILKKGWLTPNIYMYRKMTNPWLKSSSTTHLTVNMSDHANQHLLVHLADTLPLQSSASKNEHSNVIKPVGTNENMADELTKLF